MNEPDMIPVSVRAAARLAHDELDARGVPHLLAGGMAVNAYGYRRATSDVDYLVPRGALSALPGDPLPPESGVEGKTVKVRAREADGSNVEVHVDFVGVPRSRGVKAAAWAEVFALSRVVEGIPLAALEGLVLLKLVAGRVKDHADVTEILKRQPEGVARDVRRWLVSRLAGEEGRDLLADYDMLVLAARHESSGRKNPRPRWRP